MQTQFPTELYSALPPNLTELFLKWPPVVELKLQSPLWWCLETESLRDDEEKVRVGPESHEGIPQNQLPLSWPPLLLSSPKTTIWKPGGPSPDPKYRLHYGCTPRQQNCQKLRCCLTHPARANRDRSGIQEAAKYRRENLLEASPLVI